MPAHRPPPSRRKSFSPLFFLLLSFLALLSALGLDYASWRRGDKSYVFAALAAKKSSPREARLLDVFTKILSQEGIPAESVNQHTDSEGHYHLMVELPAPDFTRLAPALEEGFRTAGSGVSKSEETRGTKSFSLWEVSGGEDPRLFILFVTQKPAIPAKEKAKSQTVKNKLAIIVDDMGYSLEAAQKICDLALPVTMAILPHSPLAEDVAWLARQNDVEVMLHLPLESVNNTENSLRLPGLILSTMTEEEILEALEENLRAVPHASGVNNHMGSKITADRHLMAIICQRLKERGLYFVDSLTTGRSVAFAVAREKGLKSATRDVFLDTVNDEAHIKGQFIKLLATAREKGRAIGICHPLESTLNVLRENLGLLEEYGCEAVHASQIVY